MDYPAIVLILAISISYSIAGPPRAPSELREAYFNGSAYIRLYHPVSLHSHIGISFRSCFGGQLFFQQHSTHTIQLTALSDHVLLSLKWRNRMSDIQLPLRSLDNKWHYVGIVYRPPEIVMFDDSGHSVVVANTTFNAEVLNLTEIEDENFNLVLGSEFIGCMMEGPSLIFNTTNTQNVKFGKCPLSTEKCSDKKDMLSLTPMDHCYNEPCMGHGICISRKDRYECKCYARYAGNNCQIDNGPQCDLSLCLNGGHCEETKDGDYTCTCTSNFFGQHCELDIASHPLCIQNACHNNGTCRFLPNSENYLCICPPGFTGFKCETNVDDCLNVPQPPCQNGGICQDGINNYTCICGNTGYTGARCEINVNECNLEPGPCLNQGVCFDTYGGYMCHCQPGYAGNNCESYQNECLSSPCLNGGTCEDMHGSYRCNCPIDASGPRCALKRSVRCVDTDCPPHSTCSELGPNGPTCVCDEGYYGTPPNCTITPTTECHSNPCRNGGTCSYDMIENTFNCSCPPGFTGIHCEQSMMSLPMSEISSSPWNRGFLSCADHPCVHSLSCEDRPEGYLCKCKPGWTGVNCENSINECRSDPCQNGGECSNQLNTFYCHCPPGFTGKMCERSVGQMCNNHPCQNGGTCISIKNNTEFLCECPVGFEGSLCEKNIDECAHVTCPEHQVCYDGDNSYTCRCQDGFTGENCTIAMNFCASNPCVNNGTCKEGGGSNNYTCTCPIDFTGHNCEIDKDECAQYPNICNQGICVNKPGSYECYCTPGFTGAHCDIDFDECLSTPCKNNGTCVNKINNFECICTPGFAGKDCSININECDSNPCMEGSTCIDGLATFKCICMEGLTGSTCEINIDDCESMPCHNGGICEDGLNSYTCNCNDTGHLGPQCDSNIDDCASNPCVHGSICHDGIKDYTCECYPGYTGKNCEIIIQECQPDTCRNKGECLERNNASLYQNTSYDPLNPIYLHENSNFLLPLHFYQEFSYENASGFECVCVPGTTGIRCETDINECDSSPCGPYGLCTDRIGHYICDCEKGFEGVHCQKEINECEKFKPCIHGVCHDRRANYYCECEPEWGGKNCSVVLQGCATNHCLNSGMCHPWLFNETDHRFNCTCNTGYYGNTCEKITTMSLSGNSYVAVNTTRDIGYDIQLRFKTTLENGLLAIGKGLTFYILELANGRLNLHSSILNKWEGVFIGSKLNNNTWQKVFVTINTSHLVLAANEEQTIYPINLNEGNISYTSFQTTYVGGTKISLNGLPQHTRATLIGCVEDVIINGEWVLPDEYLDADSPESSTMMDPSNSMPFSSSSSSIEFFNIKMHCPRVEQCGPTNPCHSGGRCTDLWTSFHCSCQRPYLGNTCQYNVTAATFGHENTSNSLVTVAVFDSARRAVRSVVDISMFIRTRKPTGQIFYLGSKPKSGSYSEEIFVAASLNHGELFVRLQFNQTSEAYTVGGNRLDNGYNHLIQVVRNSTLVQVKLNGSEYFRKPISATGQLDAQVLYLGGQPILTPNRAIRQAEISSSVGSGSSDIPSNLRAEPVLTGSPSALAEADYFKGILQDVQISNGSRTMVVEFFPLQVTDVEMPQPFGTVTFDNNTILEGIISDNSCVNNPCKHNGTCHVTWNDFSCTCPRGFKGKTCQEMEFCQLQDCPIGSTCRNLDDGYECIANATFDGNNTTLSFNLTIVNQTSEAEPVNVDSISLVYRSKTGGTLLHIENSDGDMLSISVFLDQVAVNWRFSPSQVPEVRRFRKSQPDFDWTRIHILISDNQIRGGFNDWLKEELPAFDSQFDSEAWVELLKNGEIYLGGVRTPGSEENSIDPSPSSLSSYDSILRNDSIHGRSFNPQNYYSTGNFMDNKNDGLMIGNNMNFLGTPYSTEDNSQDGNDFWTGSEGTVGGNFKGCLGEVRIGDLLLPFYTLLELYPDFNLVQPDRYYFSLLTERGDSAPLGCTLCFEKDCLNGGHCSEPSSNYACTCPVGYASDNCGIDINECADNRCQNNSTCVDGIGNYTCSCLPGWEGWLCDVDIDECASQPCNNGGVCNDLPGGFSCVCPDEFTGPLCSSPILLTCAQQPCRAGSTCINKKDPITNNNFTCACLPDYEGVLCDVPFCVIRPCVNGGLCDSVTDIVPVCKCPPGFSGKFCEINIDECKIDGKSPCLNGGRCIDGIAEYTCDCHGTGYTGVHCEEDINECISENISCGEKGICINTNGSYMCHCEHGRCGNNCSLLDPCLEIRSRENKHNDITSDHINGDTIDNGMPNDHFNHTLEYREIIGPCENGGICQPRCTNVQDYICECINGWGGKNCLDPLVVAAEADGAPIGIIIGGIVGGLCALGGIALVAACMLARSKRATRGTYSPSGQEYRNPRLEMLDSVLKPPPEERLI